MNLGYTDKILVGRTTIHNCIHYCKKKSIFVTLFLYSDMVSKQLFFFSTLGE